MAAEKVSTPTPAAEKKNPFGQKKANIVIFRLLQKNPKIRPDTPEYPPYIRFPNTDIILGASGDGTTAIRYLPGFKSVYVEEQEKGNREIKENILQNPNNRFEIDRGDLKVQSHDITKIEFLRACNRNIDSKFRTGRTYPIFAEYSEEKTAAEMEEKQLAQKEAIDKAFTATPGQIAFHARYLGIAIVDLNTNATRSQKAIEADYRQLALDNPVDFIKTYDDKDLKDKFYIESAFDSFKISTQIIPGKIAWTSSKLEICDVVTGLSPTDSFFQYARTTKEGEVALSQLRNN